MGIIEVEGMRFYAYHGFYESERIAGNEFIVDVTIETDCSEAAKSDKLNDALNYQEVFDIVKSEMNISSRLLEHVAGRIIEALWNAFQEVESIKVRVTKVNPPMGGEVEKASVTLLQKK